MKQPTGDPRSSASSEILLNAAQFLDVMFDKLVPLEHSGVARDLFLYWRKKGLLPFFPKGAWARFSFAQLIWLRMLVDLRDFGYSLQNMQRLAAYLFQRAYEDHLPEHNLTVALAAINQKAVAGLMSEQEQHLKVYLEETLKDDALLHAFKYNINYLTNLIAVCLKSGEEAGLVIFKEGEIAEYYQGAYHSGGGGAADPLRPHLYLSVRHYLREFVSSVNLSQVITPLQLFSEPEQKILREIKTPGVREVRIELREGKVQNIESTSDALLTGAQAAKIKTALGLHNYERIQVDTVDAKTLLVRKTRKKL